jgi:hypothetical protein
MKKCPLFLFQVTLVALIVISCQPSVKKAYPQPDSMITLSKQQLKDKIKGGWAGQVMGVTYGGPTEFKYMGSIIQDYVPVPWDETRYQYWYTQSPGLYDDIYMDLTFVGVFEKEGLDAPAGSHALAFANAEYALWHANQAARYNILNGMLPPQSGHWKNNPHADDIDFQIESDFAGLMCPGMINSATAVCDKIGHIMNYGDGWYGGVFVASMYTLAFVSDDRLWIVKEALRTLPGESDFYKCIQDVISWHEKYPGDWMQTWFEVQKKWTSEVGCPVGVFNVFDIDAKLNAAYIVIGLLYGNGDFTKTIDISTRCGQDSDCNPSNAAGILGTIIGYSNIPDYWKQGLDKVEDMDFKYTDISLTEAYEMSYHQALQMIERNKGSILEDSVMIAFQTPEKVRYEKSFEDHYPVDMIDFGWEGKTLETGKETSYTFDFEGVGFVISGNIFKDEALPDTIMNIELNIDNIKPETEILPYNFRTRRMEIAFRYNLPEGKHTVKLSLKEPKKGYRLKIEKILFYNSKAGKI